MKIATFNVNGIGSFFVRLAGVIAEGQRLKLRRFATLSVLPFPQMVLWKDLDPGSSPDL